MECITLYMELYMEFTSMMCDGFSMWLRPIKKVKESCKWKKIHKMNIFDHLFFDFFFLWKGDEGLVRLRCWNSVRGLVNLWAVNAALEIFAFHPKRNSCHSFQSWNYVLPMHGKESVWVYMHVGLEHRQCTYKIIKLRRDCPTIPPEPQLLYSEWRHCGKSANLVLTVDRNQRGRRR